MFLLFYILILLYTFLFLFYLEFSKEKQCDITHNCYNCYKLVTYGRRDSTVEETPVHVYYTYLKPT